MVPRDGLALLALLTACASARIPTVTEATPGVVFPMHLGEGHGDGAVGEPLPVSSSTPVDAPAAAAAESTLPNSAASDPPDPAPLRQAAQYEYTFRYERGHVSLDGVRAVSFRQPVVTARRLGRFALELWIGRELVERVRFDFPLLGSDEPHQGPHSLHEPPTMTGGPFFARVIVPSAERARTARLIDRASRDQATLPWPPRPSAMPALAPSPPAPTPSATEPRPPSATPSPPSSSAPAAVPLAP